MAYIKAFLDVQLTDEATAELEIIKTRSPESADAWPIDGALALQMKQLPLAEQQLQRYLDLVEGQPLDQQTPEIRRGRAQALMSMAQIAQLRKQPEKADAWLQRVDNPDDLLRAQIRRASIMAPVSYTHLDVYKRQCLSSGWAILISACRHLGTSTSASPSGAALCCVVR